MTFNEAWDTFSPKPKDWDDGETGYLKTRAKRQLKEAKSGSEYRRNHALRLFRTIGLEVDPSRDERCIRKLLEPEKYVWNLYDREGRLTIGGFNRKTEAENYCASLENQQREIARSWNWKYEPAQLLFDVRFS